MEAGGPSRDYVGELRELARTLTPERFEGRFPWTFLVITSPDNAQVIEYTTLKGNFISPAGGTILHLLPMVKTATAYSGLTSLLVGRSRACDLPILDASISKTHARFTLARGLPHTLEDLGSRNGTRLGTKPLTPHEPVAARVGDAVSFGSVSARILDAGSLYALLGGGLGG